MAVLFDSQILIINHPICIFIFFFKAAHSLTNFGWKGKKNIWYLIFQKKKHCKIVIVTVKKEHLKSKMQLHKWIFIYKICKLFESKIFGKSCYLQFFWQNKTPRTFFLLFSCVALVNSSQNPNQKGKVSGAGHRWLFLMMSWNEQSWTKPNCRLEDLLWFVSQIKQPHCGN